jgi:predicted nucleic acid-binding protein
LSGSDTPAFLDTNYVVRYILDSPPEMAEQAARIIDSHEMLILSEWVILESAYVLDSVYQVSRQDIVDALSDLVQRQNLILPVLPKPRALAALGLCRRSKRCSFTDAFLWAHAFETGGRVYTFDRRFPSEGITLLGSKRRPAS